jgi:hypothetical protein
MRNIKYWVSFFISVTASTAALAEATMTWRIKNNFPMFPDRTALTRYVDTVAAGIGPADSIAGPPERKLDAGLARRVRVQDSDHHKTMHDVKHLVEISWTGGPTGSCTVRYQTNTTLSERSVNDCTQGSLEDIASIDIKFTAQLIFQGEIQAALEGVPKDFTIIGIGDSYASGEGNPDEPAVHRDGYECATEGGRCTQSSAFRWTKEYRAITHANWMDRPCHRSLYSNQVQAAASYAVANPQKLVRFASWSCSGAEIMDGLLRPQSSPPGGGTIKDAQLDSATRVLCRTAVRSVPLDVSGSPRLRANDPTEKMINILACDDMKRPDVLLFSIGGNDVNFGSVVVNLIAPGSGNRLYRTALAFGPERQTPEKAGSQINNGWLRTRYALLNAALRQSLVGSTNTGSETKVIQLNYPNPLIFAGSTARGCQTRKDLGTDTIAELFSATQNGGFRILEQESVRTTRFLIGPLQSTVLSNSAYGWTIAQSHMKEWEQHGFCSPEAGQDRALEYAFPKYSTRNNGMWDPSLPKPTDWNGYARTSRWIRMPNDAYMTQWILEYNRLFPSASQIVPYAEALFGTAHPNAYGQAAFAQAVLAEFPN